LFPLPWRGEGWGEGDKKGGESFMTEKNIKNNKDYSNRNPYTLIQDYFLVHWVNTIGLGPAILYIELLSYCHK
jgi:hypothetical protein